MSTENENEIKRYLLGALTERACEQIENNLLITHEGLEGIKLIEETLIDDYLTGDLSETERQQFENIFLCTAERQSKLDYLRALRHAAQNRTEPEPAPGAVFFLRRLARNVTQHMPETHQWPKLAAAILLVVSGAFVVRQLWPPAPFDQNLIALNRAYAAQRPLETRIAGFNYAPFAPSRGANETESGDRILRERAERILLDAVTEKPTAANKHLLGKFYLAEKRFDQAIEQFKSVVKETPQDAAAENDLGAALFELSKLEAFRNQVAESMQHQAESFEHFSRALELQPGYLEALFNLALCKERMLLRDQAAEDWGRYLQLDSTSKWADEARQRLDQIQKTGQRHKYDPEMWYGDFKSACERGDDNRAFELISDSYQSNGNLITERLIDEYLDAKEKLDEAVSEKRLQCLDYAARLAYQRAHESYFTELARYYRQSSPQQRFLTREARRKTQEAIILSRKGNKKDAAEKLIAVEQQYHWAGNDSESVFARYLRGIILLRLGDFEECRSIFQPISQPSNSFLWLRGQALSSLSDLYERLGMLSEALRSAQLAVGIADQLQDTSFRLKSLNQAATYWYLLGDWRKSLAYLGRARGIAAVKPSASIDLWVTEDTSALVCSDLQFLRTAAALQLQTVKIAEEMQRELQISRSYTNLGVIMGLQGDFASAIRVTKRGYALGARYSTPQDARVITDYSGLQLAHLQRKSGDNEAAVETYSEILSRIQNETQPVYQFDAYRGKALAEIAQGKRVEAQRDLDAALQIFERNRKAIWDENARNRFFDREYEIYDAAISLAYASSPQRAFEYSERSRAKSLRELLGDSPARQFKDALPRTLPAIQHALPADVILLQYAALPDQLLIWGVTHEHFVSASVPIRAAELERQVTLFFGSISRRNAPVEQYGPLAQALSRLLMEPLGSFIAEGATLVIIPDKFLNYVPFSALISPRTGQYLVERHPIILAPSATVFLQCAENAARRSPAQSEQLLAIGNPSFDTNAYPNLENLTNAVRETNEIAAFYPNKHVLLGAQADERTAVAEISNADVIHLALHGVKDPLSPLNSFLLFARTEGRAPEDGRLQAHEIGWIKSARARLAVLSACQSGVETYYRGEGMIGLSRSFLSIGIPTVVASFWSVDSSATANLMITFHKVMRLDRLSPAKALQQAQMTLAKGNQSLYQAPYYWAGFCAFGGESTPSITTRGANHACIDDHQYASYTPIRLKDVIARINIHGLFVLCINQVDQIAQFGAYELASGHSLSLKMFEKPVEDKIDTLTFREPDPSIVLDTLPPGDILIDAPGADRALKLQLYESSELAESETFFKTDNFLPPNADDGLDYRWIANLDHPKFRQDLFNMPKGAYFKMLPGIVSRKVQVSHGVLYTGQFADRIIRWAFESHAVQYGGLEKLQEIARLASIISISIPRHRSIKSITLSIGDSSPAKKYTLSLPVKGDSFYEINITNLCPNPEAISRRTNSDFQYYYNVIDVPIARRVDFSPIRGFFATNRAPCDPMFLEGTPEIPF